MNPDKTKITFNSFTSLLLAATIASAALPGTQAQAAAIHIGDQFGAATIVDIRCSGGSEKRPATHDFESEDGSVMIRNGEITILSTGRMQCSTKREIETVLTSVTLSLNFGSAIAACFGPVSIAGTITIGIAELILGTATFALSQVDCEDPADEAKTQYQIHSMICEELERSGIPCEL